MSLSDNAVVYVPDRNKLLSSGTFEPIIDRFKQNGNHNENNDNAFVDKHSCLHVQ